MSDIMDSNYAQMKSYVERNKFPFNESAEQNCKRGIRGTQHLIGSQTASQHRSI